MYVRDLEQFQDDTVRVWCVTGTSVRTYTILNKPLGIALVSIHTQPTASSHRYHHSND